MFRTLPLLHELERRARALGFTWASLAAEVGIDRTTLAHIRSGRGRLSLGTLHRIAAWFPTDTAIQRCVWEYLLHDVETQKERTAREALRAHSAAGLLASFDTPAREWLGAFVAQFGDYAVRGQSVLLRAPTPRHLASALSFLETELTARGTRVLRLQANAHPEESLLPSLLATPLLLVERYEFASPPIARVVAERCRYGKVTVATIGASGRGPLGAAARGWASSFLHGVPGTTMQPKPATISARKRGGRASEEQRSSQADGQCSSECASVVP